MAPRLLFVLRILSCSFAILLTLIPVSGQTLSEGWSAFDARYGKVRNRARGFFNGAERIDPSDKSQVEAIDLHAKYYTYGVYLQHLEQPPYGRIEKDYSAFDSEVTKILTAQDREIMQPLADLFRDKIRIYALEMIQFGEAKPVHKIHNARLLAKIAELGQGALSETLITILKDPAQNDGVRYYVLRGLGTLLGLSQPMQKNPALTKEEETKTVEALIDFLEKRKGPPEKAAREEVEGFRVLRREAVRALAQCRAPVVNEKLRPALLLARIAGGDGRFQPAPRLDERVEASIGLARMQTGKNKQYQADYAAGQIAKTLGAFAQSYDKEREQRDNRTLPWRVDAARLNDALTALQTDSGKNPYVAEVFKRGSRTLQEIVKGSTPSNTYSDDETWLAGPQSDPPSKELFQGAADSAVKPAQPGEESPDK